MVLGDELEMAGRLELLMDRFVVVSMRGDVEYGPAYGFYHMVTEGDPNPRGRLYKLTCRTIY